MGPEVVELIRRKRDGGHLAAADIAGCISGYARGEVPDEQMSALLMAVYFQGLAPTELRAWTQAMVDSGRRMDLSAVARPTVDKHSTGGVGDKISLILAPLVAACGAAVPQLSGRGLGHTGGTLDKLDAVPGFRSALDPAAIIAQLAQVGCVIAAASADLAPADRRLYALRDITGTVESIPLIASSIMAKKIAEGTGALVLDVKVGSGAFMADRAQARTLAATMLSLGAEYGVRSTAVLTRMDAPLGGAVGNAVEVAESLEVLAGGGPTDVVDLTVALAQRMLELVGITADPAAALRDGRAMDRFREMVRAQGGDPDAPLPQPRHREVVAAPASGYLRRLDARAVGVAAWRLGAGRSRKEDLVSPAAGVLCRARPGDRVRAGQALFELHTDDPARVPSARAALVDAVEIGPTTIADVDVVIEDVTAMETGMR